MGKGKLSVGLYGLQPLYARVGRESDEVSLNAGGPAE